MIIIIINLLIALGIVFYGVYTIDRWLFLKKKRLSEEVIYEEENKTTAYKVYNIIIVIFCILTLVSVVIDYEQIQFFLIAILLVNIYLLQNESNKLIIDNETVNTEYKTIYFEDIESVEFLDNSNDKKYRMKLLYKKGNPQVILLMKREIILDVLKEKGIIIKEVNK